MGNIFKASIFVTLTFFISMMDTFEGKLVTGHYSKLGKSDPATRKGSLLMADEGKSSFLPMNREMRFAKDMQPVSKGGIPTSNVIETQREAIEYFPPNSHRSSKRAVPLKDQHFEYQLKLQSLDQQQLDQISKQSRQNLQRVKRSYGGPQERYPQQKTNYQNAKQYLNDRNQINDNMEGDIPDGEDQQNEDNEEITDEVEQSGRFVSDSDEAVESNDQPALNQRQQYQKNGQNRYSAIPSQRQNNGFQPENNREIQRRPSGKAQQHFQENQQFNIKPQQQPVSSNEETPINEDYPEETNQQQMDPNDRNNQENDAPDVYSQRSKMAVNPQQESISDDIESSIQEGMTSDKLQETSDSKRTINQENLAKQKILNNKRRQSSLKIYSLKPGQPIDLPKEIAPYVVGFDSYNDKAGSSDYSKFIENVEGFPSSHVQSRSAPVVKFQRPNTAKYSATSGTVPKLKSQLVKNGIVELKPYARRIKERGAYF